MIPQRNISLLANRLAKGGGRRIPEAVLERDYCLAWFLVGLSKSPIRHSLIFKGGTALKRCYFADYRFSEDLDFTLADDLPLAGILEGLGQAYDSVLRGSGIRFSFSREDRRQHHNSHTFYIAYDGPLPAAQPKEVKVDVTIREEVVCPLEQPTILRAYDEYTDFPDGHTLRAYSLDEIAIEKLVALTDHARNEPRDLYDLWYLTVENHVDMAVLQPELERKLAFRERNLANLGEALGRKKDRIRRLWNVRLAAQMTELPPFETVFRAVTRRLRNSELL